MRPLGELDGAQALRGSAPGRCSSAQALSTDLFSSGVLMLVCEVDVRDARQSCNGFVGARLK